MIDIVSERDCVGCKACGDVCPKEAISYQVNEEGFWHPTIDKTKCVKCNRCEQVCPSVHVPKRNNEQVQSVLASYHKEQSIRYESTSGGVFYALAESILHKGGYVVGCIYSGDYSKAYHVVIDSEEKLKDVIGSKYFQSDTEGIYKATKTVVEEGKPVLFCGSPCQVAALHNFLGREYNNLYLVDFVCRGINTPMAYQKYIEELELKYNSKVKKVHFKNKSHGWLNLGTYVEFQNGKKYYRNRYMDPWVNAFVVGNLYMRQACSECNYKTLPRISDISLGDFWGQHFTKDEAKNGLSLIMVNNDKGKRLIKDSSSRLQLTKKSLDEAIEGNPAILNSIPPSSHREEFFERIHKEPYSGIVWDLIGSNPFQRCVKSLYEQIKIYIWVRVR